MPGGLLIAIQVIPVVVDAIVRLGGVFGKKKRRANVKRLEASNDNE